MTKHLISFLIGLFTASSFAAAPAPNLSGPLPNFIQVNDQLFRGGRPTADGLQILKTKGIKTLINLEDSPSAIEFESQTATALGLGERSYPLSATRKPSRAEVKKILADLQNPELFPIYLHCRHGEDRTGYVMGLYRVLVDQWSHLQAHREMLTDGFHVMYAELEISFWTTPVASLGLAR